MIEEEVVTWAFRLLLGREPESDAVIESVAKHSTSIAQLRTVLMTSPEFRSKTGVDVRIDGRFESKAASGPCIMIASNCQGPELARHLAATASCRVIGREVMTYRKEEIANWMEDFDRADHIFMVPLGERFDGIRIEQIKARYPGRVSVMSALAFEGLHPDLIMLGEMNERLYGPMGHHSGIVLYSFLSGMTPRECIGHFNHEGFARMGYFEKWETSRERLCQADSEHDLNLADEFFARVRDEPLMMTTNHPTPVVYQMIARKICDRVGLDHRPIPLNSSVSIQAFMPVWPVYDDIAKFHNLSYRTSQMFMREHTGWDLPEFVDRSYELYRQQGRTLLLDALNSESKKRPLRWVSNGRIVPLR